MVGPTETQLQPLAGGLNLGSLHLPKVGPSTGCRGKAAAKAAIVRILPKGADQDETRDRVLNRSGSLDEFARSRGNSRLPFTFAAINPIGFPTSMRPQGFPSV